MNRLLLLALVAGSFEGVACGDSEPTDDGVDASAATDVSMGAALSDVGVATGATTYYIVRHTERNPGQDPPINAEGETRAEAIADRLEGAGVDEIIATMFIRGQQSGQPLADRLGQSITVAPFTMTDWSSFAGEVSGWQRAREVAGSTYLMVGHAGGYNSTLLRGLGAEEVPARNGERYEDLVILIRELDGTVRVSAETYGGASSLDP
ncbi:MAG: phosphohistidine phosphatase SixA [Polyangiales bacterium]|jgi:phosphohistidine phosphatase SixA